MAAGQCGLRWGQARQQGRHRVRASGPGDTGAWQTQHNITQDGMLAGPAGACCACTPTLPAAHAHQPSKQHRHVAPNAHLSTSALIPWKSSHSGEAPAACPAAAAGGQQGRGVSRRRQGLKPAGTAGTSPCYSGRSCRTAARHLACVSAGRSKHNQGRTSRARMMARLGLGRQSKK